jgi:hypothetical protein
MKIITHPFAQKEFERQIQWLKKYGYLVNSADIFYNEIQAALDDLGSRTHHPEVADAPGYYRVGPTPTYSYFLIYKMVENEIHLLAIAAPQRRPGYWKRRKI